MLDELKSYLHACKGSGGMKHACCAAYISCLILDHATLSRCSSRQAGMQKDKHADKQRGLR